MATGNEKMMAYIKDCYANQSPLGPLHRKAMDLFRLYMLLGGMPQVIQTYIDTHDFRQTEKIKQNILALYRDDIHKYATGAEAKAAGHKLYYFYQYDDHDSGNTMEIDFLVSKPSVTSRKNICPIEVKSSPRYALSSLKKCMTKFSQYVTRPIVLHTKDLEIKDDILYLPLYMTGLL